MPLSCVSQTSANLRFVRDQSTSEAHSDTDCDQSAWFEQVQNEVPLPASTPLHLPIDQKLAQGGGRMVFAHPENPDVVIKIARSKKVQRNPLRKLFSRSAAFGPIWNSYVEIREYTRSVSYARRASKIYAQFLGFVETSQGTGAMFEAVRAPDGQLATTLYRHTEQHGHEPAMEDAIRALWAEIKETWLVISDRAMANLVVTGDATNGYHLTIVDGVGDRTLIPLKVWSKKIYDKRCDRYVLLMLSKYRALAAKQQ